MDDTQILEFIKDQTGIQRTKSGALVENVSIFWKIVLQNISGLLLYMQRLDNMRLRQKQKSNPVFAINDRLPNLERWMSERNPLSTRKKK